MNDDIFYDCNDNIIFDIIEQFKNHQKYLFELFQRTDNSKIINLVHIIDKLKSLITIIDDKKNGYINDNIGIAGIIANLHIDIYYYLKNLIQQGIYGFYNSLKNNQLIYVQKLEFDYFMANLDKYDCLDKFAIRKIIHQKNKLYNYESSDNILEYNLFCAKLQKQLIVNKNNIEIFSEKELSEILHEFSCYLIMMIIAPNLKNILMRK